jgi:NAD(P)-dependent dehydrogenase (short-subunit alcohol dehydrogenase family)
MSWSVGAGLEGKVTLVTGAAGGIGAEVARQFALAGARVAVSDVDAGALEVLVGELDGPEHRALPTDLRDRAQPQHLVDSVGAELGRLDVVAHCAAALVRRDELTQVTDDEYDLQQEVNLRATFYLGRAAAEAMRAQGAGGRIINFASQGWWTGGFGGSIVYSATKGGVVSLTRGLARTYGPDGILVNCIAPGAVDTPMLTGGLDRDAYEAFVAQIPLGRVARPDEVAGVAVFLASKHASYISGATINVSGAQLMY